MKVIFHAIWRYIKQTDIILVLFSLMAAGYGLILIYSAKGTGRTVLVQVIGIVLGLIIMVVLSKIDYHNIAKLWRYIAVGCILLFVLTLILGKSRAGSQDKSWIWLGPVTIQPGEFIKVAFAITFSMHCDKVKENINSPRNILLLTLHTLIPVCFLVLQRDMGMMLVFILMFAVMMYMANVKLRYFVFAGIVTLIGAPYFWNKVLKSTQKNRILALFDPIKYSQVAYQQTQGVHAIGSGEMFGYGLFHGPLTQSSASLLPEKQNDMIFAVAGEELGFIGCILILIIILILIVRMVSDAHKSKDNLGAIICTGIFASFAVQMFINIGAALMIFPITGISLPFFSSGASSLVSCFSAIGLILSVYMHRTTTMFAGKDE